MEMDKKTWKKILFLDIDGVLASVDFLMKNNRKGFIEKEKIALLNQLKPYDVEVVISSSWGYNEDTVNTLKSCGLELPIIGGIDHFYSGWICRGNEIAKWLINTFDNYNLFTGKPYIHENYKGDDYEYVILDDDEDMLLCQKDNFIHVDRNTALTEEHINKSIDILERKNLKK